MLTMFFLQNKDIMSILWILITWYNVLPVWRKYDAAPVPDQTQNEIPQETTGMRIHSCGRLILGKRINMYHVYGQIIIKLVVWVSNFYHYLRTSTCILFLILWPWPWIFKIKSDPDLDTRM